MGPSTTRWLTGTAVAAALTACGGPASLAELHPDSTCRTVITVGPLGTPATGPAHTVSGSPATEAPAPESEPAPPLRWILPERAGELHRLNAWCAAVGPAAVGGWADPPAGGLVADSLLVVAWNLHVGGAHLRDLVHDIRSGVLTGGSPVPHFVLLLQEAYRGGDFVPDFDPSLPGGSAVASAPVTGEREDILADARELGLSVFYVPNMRNASAPGGPREDRGGAILATVPLEDRIAIELPVARQRRVALGGYVAGRTTDGRVWRLHVATVHLENNAAGWVSDERARLEQTRALLRSLPDADRAEPAIAAGDFNTWSRGRDEALVREMLRVYPDTPPFPEGPTYRRGFGVIRQYLDYMFFRLPDDARAHYRRVPDLYNSDHYPLVGWIVFRADGGP